MSGRPRPSSHSPIRHPPGNPRPRRVVSSDMRRTVLLAVIAVLLAGAACSDEDETRTEGEATDPSEVVEADDTQPVTWHLTAAPDGAELVLRAQFGGSSCTDFRDWRVDEADDEVRIEARVHVEPGDCTSDLVFEDHTVTLEEPLGERRLTGCAPDDPSVDCSTVTPSP